MGDEGPTKDQQQCHGSGSGRAFYRWKFEDPSLDRTMPRPQRTQQAKSLRQQGRKTSESITLHRSGNSTDVKLECNWATEARVRSDQKLPNDGLERVARGHEITIMSWRAIQAFAACIVAAPGSVGIMLSVWGMV